MIAIYFSGTGNTRFCVEYLIDKLNCGVQSYSIEDKGIKEKIKSSDKIIFAYPVYYSNMPKIVRDFIYSNKELWNGKKIFILVTMGLFSGDGSGVSARVLKRYGAEIIGGAHIKMPDCIGDVKALKKPLNENKKIVNQAKVKISEIADTYNQSGKLPKTGLSFISRIIGLFGQRLYFRNKTKNYTDKLKIDGKKCIGCGKCSRLCPMKNIEIEDNKSISHSKCTMCYRCISNCPVQAITLIGDTVFEQSVIEKYI